MADENIASKDGRFRIVSLTPDVCLTPSKNGVPVPYPITHQMNQSRQCSPNVFLQGKPVYLHNQSYVDKVIGDEPGHGNSLVSQTNITKSTTAKPSTSMAGPSCAPATRCG